VLETCNDFVLATKVYFNDMFQAISHIEKIAGGADKAPEIWYVGLFSLLSCFRD